MTPKYILENHNIAVTLANQYKVLGDKAMQHKYLQIANKLWEKIR